MVNLIECPNMNHIRIDLHDNSFAKKAYLGFIMTLPSGKYSKILLKRLPFK
jgi:hypothetical protein